MPGRRTTAGILAGVALVATGAALALPATRLYWRVKSANPVRRGVALARQLGCFACHGELGRQGIADPSPGQSVPTWNGGTWMMYVREKDEVRQFILHGASERRAADPPTTAAIRMPAYSSFVDAGDADDLTAAFLVLSGMKRPDAGTPEARGLELARE